MKHINTNNITTVTASSENVNFPATRLLDDSPKRVYKAEEENYSAILSAEIVGGVSDILIANTNAISASVTVTDPNLIEWGDGDTWGDDDTWGNTTISISASTLQNASSTAMLLELSNTVSVPCVATVTLSASPGDTLYAGVMTAKVSETYGGRDPYYGLGGECVDYSIKDENSNGSRYYKKRDIVRNPEVSVLMLHADARLLEANFIQYGEAPAGWKLTDQNDNYWVMYASFDGSPKIDYNHQRYASVTFRLIEVL